MKLTKEQMIEILDDVAKQANFDEQWSLVGHAMGYKETLIIAYGKHSEFSVSYAELICGLINFRETTK